MEQYEGHGTILQSVSTDDIKIVLNVLCRIDKKFKVFNSMGICGNFNTIVYRDDVLRLRSSDIISIFREIRYRITPHWEYFSGDIVYPVPRKLNDRSSAMAVYQKCTLMWMGKYGYLRRNLLKFLIRKLREEIVVRSYANLDKGEDEDETS